MKNQTYEEFYLKYRKISRAYAYGVLHDWNISDDVSQDVLYKMYTKRKHLNIDNEKMMYSLIQVKYLDVPVEVVAEEYGLTKSGVNNRIYKAKRWLKEEFRKVYE